MQENSKSSSNIYNKVAMCIRLTNIIYSAEHTQDVNYRDRKLKKN